MESFSKSAIMALFLLILQNPIIYTEETRTNGATCITSLTNLKDEKKLNISCINTISNFSPKKINVLQFNNSKISTLPELAFDSFSDLTEIHLNGSHLENLQTNAFESNKKLERLYLKQNEIKELGSGCFKYLTNLEILDVSLNQIRSINYDVFDSLNRLKTLNVSHNSLTSISNLGFSETKAIEILDFSYNELTQIDKLLLSKFRKLKKLFINNNRILALALNSYDSYEKLELVDASSNLLTGISTPDFIEINVNNNSFSVSLSLGDEIVHISKNNLPSVIITSSNTFFLNASWNQLSTLSHFNFENGRGLKIVDLSYNAIGRIESNAFINFNALLHLNLSHNVLTSFIYGTFDSLVNLKTLDITYNKFHYLYEAPNENVFGFCNSINLYEVRLYENQWAKVILDKINNFRYISIESLTESTVQSNEAISTETSALNFESNKIGNVSVSNNNKEDGVIILLMFLLCYFTKKTLLWL